MSVAVKYGEPYVSFVRGAYEKPRMTTEPAKTLVISEFRDTAYSECLKRWKF